MFDVNLSLILTLTFVVKCLELYALKAVSTLKIYASLGQLESYFNPYLFFFRGSVSTMKISFNLWNQKFSKNQRTKFQLHWLIRLINMNEKKVLSSFANDFRTCFAFCRMLRKKTKKPDLGFAPTLLYLFICLFVRFKLSVTEVYKLISQTCCCYDRIVHCCGWIGFVGNYELLGLAGFEQSIEGIRL